MDKEECDLLCVFLRYCLLQCYRKRFYNKIYKNICPQPFFINTHSCTVNIKCSTCNTKRLHIIFSTSASEWEVQRGDVCVAVKKNSVKLSEMKLSSCVSDHVPERHKTREGLNIQ